MSVMQRFDLSGKTVLVTGASSGIGAAAAKGFAECGAHVIAAARRQDRLESLVEAIRASSGKAEFALLDVTERQSIERCCDEAIRLTGRLDVVINNAGIAEPRKFVATDAESRDRTMATNFTGVWDLCHAAARRMIAAKHGGSIVNIASILGMGAAPGYAAYAASKAAVIQLTRVLALELGRQGIRVNAIAPGWFVTEMNRDYFQSDAGKAAAQRQPAGRTGELHELLGAMILLASDAGSYINGIVLPVDGGNTAALAG
jgi:NAD(P)-dependent dehydrogenase (short-subunit alcohol dehydrogenase family)